MLADFVLARPRRLFGEKYLTLPSGDSAQLSLFDIFGLAGDIEGNYSSDEIEKVIGKLRTAKRIAEKQEENERRRREKEEAERKVREEKERKEAHVREVTCMDLPLDWNNIFNSDGLDFSMQRLLSLSSSQMKKNSKLSNRQAGAERIFRLYLNMSKSICRKKCLPALSF